MLEISAGFCELVWIERERLKCFEFLQMETGLESSARPLGDDLEHSGTSQDDGKLFYLCAIPVSRQLLWQLFLLLGKCVKRNLWLHSVLLSTDFC
jgi:hypothetical protein